MSPEMEALTQRITAAMNVGVRQARAIHKALGQPIVIWLDDRIQWVDAETLQPVPPPDGPAADVTKA